MHFQEEVSSNYFLSRRRPQRTYLSHRNPCEAFHPSYDQHRLSCGLLPAQHIAKAHPFVTQPCNTGFPFLPHLSCNHRNHQSLAFDATPSHLSPDIPNTAGQLTDARAILARCPNRASSFKPTSELGNAPPRHIFAPAQAHLVGFQSMIKSTTEIPAESPPSRPPWTDLPRNASSISFLSRGLPK
ncbi:hypothetical protein H4582DRAFT_1963044 [Lactarius indigo]|nr:hypothetical protein H4582DRAFT_1963044 [Lactarius indigo]